LVAARTKQELSREAGSSSQTASYSLNDEFILGSRRIEEQVFRESSSLVNSTSDLPHTASR